MSDRRLLGHNRPTNGGFTLVEVIIMMVVASIVGLMFYAFVNSSLAQYLSLQKDGSDFTDLSYQSQRVGNVLRGLTDIVSESADDITCYAYFAPNDSYVSLIHYYKNPTSTVLYADVTPMSSNPPIGSPLTDQKKTYTIINNFYQAPGVSTFTYLDSSGNPMTLPISDEHAIQGIRITLAAQGANHSNQTMSLQVSLRNRKINL